MYLRVRKRKKNGKVHRYWSIVAQQHQVSRKFVYQQLTKATTAIDHAFEPVEPKDQKVLFYLPITKAWIRQFVLSLILICHSSIRGVLDILDAMFDYRDISLGTIHNIVQQAVASARRVNDSQDLSGIRIGDHDEIYQANRPVLVGMDHRSTYCYLLAGVCCRRNTGHGKRSMGIFGNSSEKESG